MKRKEPSKYAIKKIKTEKDEIRHPAAAEEGIIPKLSTSMLFVGKSGSGKSTLLANLLMNKEFYNKEKSFHHIFLISPTGESDDIQKSLKLPETNIVTDLVNDAIPFLEKIYTHQSETIKKHGAAHAPQICIIFDDVVANTKFMNSPIFTKCFVANRHANLTVMLCSQHFTRVPRICRLQANTLFFFALNNSETELLAEEFAPPKMKKQQFETMVSLALEKPYDFLTINMKKPWDSRFSKGLEDVLDLEYFKSL